jgi:hypothetical protein
MQVVFCVGLVQVVVQRGAQSDTFKLLDFGKRRASCSAPTGATEIDPRSPQGVFNLWARISNF